MPRRAVAWRISIAAVMAARVAIGGAAAQNATAAEPDGAAVELPQLTVEAAAKAKKAKAKKSAQPQQVPVEAVPQSLPTPSESDPRAETATGPFNGYAATRSASGTKTDTPLMEVPQAISVVGREEIQDRGAQSLQETLRYVPGVVADLFGEDARNDGFAIRGQETTVQFLDGLRRSYGNYLNVSRIEPFTLERIEVLKGPSSVLYGQSGVGGTINMVSKRPEEEQRGEIGVQYGSYDTKQATFDMTGPLTQDKTWLYRITGLARDADTIVDFADDDRLVFAPSLTYRPSVDTSVTLLGQIGRDRSGPTAQFLPLEGTLFANPNGRIPRGRNTGEPDFDRYDSDYWSVSLIADHRIDETWSVHQGLRYSHADIVYGQTLPDNFFDPLIYLDADRREVGRFITFSDRQTQVLTSDTNATARFALGPTVHKVLAGVDYSRANVGGVRDAGVIDCNVFDIYDPAYGQFEPCDFDGNPVDEIALEALADVRQSQTGLYIQDQIRLGPWIAVLGLRQDWTEAKVAGEAAEKKDALTRRAGLMYEFAFGLTPYVSYAESFVPVSGLDRDDRPFDPIEGQSIEAGFKYQPPGTSVMIVASVFDATEKNRLVPDPTDPNFDIQAGEVQLKGFEIEMRGKLTRNLDVVAGYAYTDATYVKGIENPVTLESQDGKRVESIPDHTASLWAVYTFDEGMLKGFSLGGGVRYIAGSWDGYDDFKTPSYTLLDAMLAYETESWRWTLNGTNLEDDYVISTCQSSGYCYLGAGREITTGLTYKF